MEIEELNYYLAKLEGGADVISISIDKRDETGTLCIKFNGDIGSLDSGEIELEFYGICSQKISYNLLGPISIKIEDQDIDSLLNVNYIEDECNMYVLEDSESCKWWVYAKGYNARLLAVFYGKET